MKLKLLMKMPKLGAVGDIIEASDAYARNYLIPKKLAITATADVLAAHDLDRQRRLHADQQHQADRTALIASLHGLTVRLAGKASPGGKLFAAIKGDDLRQELERQFGRRLPALRCEPDHFKTIGAQTVKVIIDDTHQAEMTLVIDHAK